MAPMLRFYFRTNTRISTHIMPLRVKINIKTKMTKKMETRQTNNGQQTKTLIKIIIIMMLRMIKTVINIKTK